MQKSDRLQGILFYQQLPTQVKPVVATPAVSNDITPIGGQARGVRRIKPSRQAVVVVNPDTNKEVANLLSRLRTKDSE